MPCVPFSIRLLDTIGYCYLFFTILLFSILYLSFGVSTSSRLYSGTVLVSRLHCCVYRCATHHEPSPDCCYPAASNTFFTQLSLQYTQSTYIDRSVHIHEPYIEQFWSTQSSGVLVLFVLYIVPTYPLPYVPDKGTASLVPVPSFKRVPIALKYSVLHTSCSTHNGLASNARKTTSFRGKGLLRLGYEMKGVVCAFRIPWFIRLVGLYECCIAW